MLQRVDVISAGISDEVAVKAPAFVIPFGAYCPEIVRQVYC